MMGALSERPRMLYFNGPWDYVGERMKESQLYPFERLLSQDFEVISVVGDCDFAVEVERHRPDVVLFHSGCELVGEPHVKIRNTDRYREVPRLGFMWRDPFTPSRALPMNRFREWGVDQVVTLFRQSDAPSAYFQDTLYLPFWVDDGLFRDYGEEKEIPVTFAGEGWFSTEIYDWRSEIMAGLLPTVPFFHSRSLANGLKKHAYCGERYARLLNRSWFSAGCGSVCRYLTLKLLEIPAARCCLIAQDIEVLRAIGFDDGVNCVFATKETVEEKVTSLLADTDRLRAITDAGYALVHAGHTQRNRRLFREWYELWKAKGPGQRIVQVDPFKPLELAEASSPLPELNFPKENPIRERMLEGYRLIGVGLWQEALACFNYVLKYLLCVAAARLGAAMCEMMLGRDEKAFEQLNYSVLVMLKYFNGNRPDAIDLAFLGIVTFRLGRCDEAMAVLASHPEMKHPMLNATRWYFRQLQPALEGEAAFRVEAGDMERTVETVHIFDQGSFEGWLALVQQFVGVEVTVKGEGGRMQEECVG